MSNTKKPSGQIREFRSKVAKLKELGLISKRVDARSQRMTRHMKEQIKKYSDVLEKRATVVHLSRAKAKEYADVFRTKGKSIVVPHEKTERVYTTRKGEIRSTLQVGSRKVKKLFPKSNDPSKLPSGKNVRYTLKMNWGRDYGAISFETFRELDEFMNTDSMRNFLTWKKYVIVEIIDPKTDMHFDEDGGE